MAKKDSDTAVLDTESADTEATDADAVSTDETAAVATVPVIIPDGPYTPILNVLAQWEESGLTVAQLRLLFHLGNSDGASNSSIANMLNITRPSISAMLERLELAAFVRREISKADRRGIEIWLEPKGREAIALIAAS